MKSRVLELKSPVAPKADEVKGSVYRIADATALIGVYASHLFFQNLLDLAIS